MSLQRHPTAHSVLSTPLLLHSLTPVTGYARDGFCSSNPSDPGQHTIAGVITEAFLDYTAKKGNNLRVLGPDMKEGCRWCLCVSRWKEVLNDFREGKVGREVVPKVRLGATDQTVLEGTGVTMKDLEEFKATD